jgi:Predicted esterase
MALIRLDHLTQTTQVCQPLNIILPDPGNMKGIPVRQRKVLYLLHGLSDDASAWQRFTSIETLAADYGLVVVMPTVGRSFYADQPNGQRYFSYLVEELPQYLADVFDLAPRREDTFIAGLSMGGYGAMKAALLHPERFSAAASFSGVLTLNGFDPHFASEKKLNEFAYLFGDLGKLPGSEHDPMVWLQRAAQNGAALPKLYVSCGRQDELLPMSQFFTAECKRLKLDVEYYDEDGAHEWYFWDRQIRRFLKLILGDLPNGKH